MLQFLFALLSLAIAVTAVVMYKTYFYIPPRELKRQASAHDPLANVLWQAVGYGDALRALLWFITVVFAGVGFVLLTQLAPTILAMIGVGFLLLVTFAWLPNTRLTSFGGRITVTLTPILVWVLGQLAPLLRWLHAHMQRYAEASHTGLFQREDLVEVLLQQKGQPDNRIDEMELDMAIASLKFGARHVRDIFVPRKRVHSISADDSIGPIMLDELHRTKHSRFPVYDGDVKNIVGTLYLYDLVEQRIAGQPKVSTVMEPRVFYVHESDSLIDVLHTFHHTKHQLFVVINSFDEYLGIITLEDVLAQIIGRDIMAPEGEAYNRHEVVKRHAPKPKPAEIEESVQPQPEESDEPVPQQDDK